MTGIGSTLVTNNSIDIPCKNIDNFAFTFVAPI
jgi:hypothetical protein